MLPFLFLSSRERRKEKGRKEETNVGKRVDSPRPSGKKAIRAQGISPYSSLAWSQCFSPGIGYSSPSVFRLLAYYILWLRREPNDLMARVVKVQFYMTLGLVLILYEPKICLKISARDFWP